MADLETQLAKAEVRVAHLETLLDFAADRLIELNPSNYSHDDICQANDATIDVIRALVEVKVTPIDMVLYCPSCGTIHIDKPEPDNGWENPPHRSHLCANCGHIWRPADVATNGVAGILTKGAADSQQPPMLDPSTRLHRIAEIIWRVDLRCSAADGPVTPTLQEMTQAEISEIWDRAKPFYPPAVEPEAKS